MAQIVRYAVPRDNRLWPGPGEVVVGGADGTPQKQDRTSALADLGRPPRVLIVSESILNSGSLDTKLAAAVPGIVIERRTYGGSQSPLGLLLTAADQQAYVTPGNLLKNSDVAHWPSKTSLTATAATSPTTGRPTNRLDVTGVGGQRIQASTDGVTVPATPPASMVFSVVIEPGTLRTFRILVYNTTKAGTIIQRDFAPGQAGYGPNVRSRYAVSFTATTGVGYAAGDALDFILYVGTGEGNAAGNLYADAPMVNAGGLPAPYSPTSGTAQAVGTPAWQTPRLAVDPRLFDLVVLQWGRNDASGVPWADHERLLAAQISGAARLGARVLVCTCPPQAKSDLSGWEPVANDPYQLNPYRVNARRAARQAGAAFYDAVSDFPGSGLAVNALMRDIYHPTETGAGLGMQRYADQIVAALNAPVDPPARALAAPPVSRIGAEPVTGTWAWTTFTSTNANLGNVEGFITGRQPAGSAAVFPALASSTAGDQVTATVSGTVVGLVALVDASSAGQVDVSVDGGPAVRVNLLKAGLTMYPQGVYIAGGLPDTDHTVTITVVSGQARIIGVVGA